MLDEGDGRRISVKEFKDVLDSGHKATIIDVRPRTEFGICKIPDSINIPLNDLVANPEHFFLESDTAHAQSLYIVCRLGNDSQIAAIALRDAGCGSKVVDVIGGLNAWAKTVDNTFPIY